MRVLRAVRCEACLLGGEAVAVFLAKLVNAATFRTALKAMGKNSENKSSKIYNFSSMKKYKDEYMRGFTDLKGQRQLNYKPACQKDIKAGRFLCSRSAWDTASPGQGVIEIRISGQSPTQLIYHLCL